MIAVEVPASFAPVWRWTLRVERGPTDGRVDDPDDRGGRTKDGVTQRTYDAFRHAHGLASADVWEMPDDEAQEIYFLDFWLRGRCDLISDRTENPDGVVAPRLALVHYDACINHGLRGVSKKTGRVFGANAMLQEVLGAQPIDGWVGKKTLDALDARLGVRAHADPATWRAAESVLIEHYLARRKRLYDAIARQPGQAKYLRGWLGRLDALRTVAASLT